jgi:hypothetical protein
MSEHEERENVLIGHIAEVLRAPEPTAPDFTARLMAVVNAVSRSALALAGAQSGARAGARVWWRRRRTIQLSLSPLGALSLGAGLAALALVADLTMRGSRAPAERTTLASAATSTAQNATAHIDTVHLVRFVFMAPKASSVTMVGDFNNWNRVVTPLRRSGAGGTWTVSVSLPAGPHQYAFVVDGTAWTPDPASTTTVSDDFGTTTSVIAVGGAS